MKYNTRLAWRIVQVKVHAWKIGLSVALMEEFA
jgi:hypothetical protein